MAGVTDEWMKVRARRWLRVCMAGLTMSVTSAACNGHEQGKTELRTGECASCHRDEALKATEPRHDSATFENGCGSCHDEMKWQPASLFVHTSAFPLTQAHDGPTCSACHTRGFAPGDTSTACVSCHEDRASAVTDPIHAGLSRDCFACHRTDSFSPAHFVHSWPLKGVHATLTCSSCHQGSPARYEGTPSTCIDCHAEDRAFADMNVEGHASYPSTCETCHNFDGFASAAP